MSARLYCDACGKDITTETNDRARAKEFEHTFPSPHRSLTPLITVKVTAMVGVRDSWGGSDGVTWNDVDLCVDCLRTAIVEGRVRPA